MWTDAQIDACRDTNMHASPYKRPQRRTHACMLGRIHVRTDDREDAHTDKDQLTHRPTRGRTQRDPRSETHTGERADGRTEGWMEG